MRHPSPHPTRVSGEHRELPVGPEQSPSQKQISRILFVIETIWWKEGKFNLFIDNYSDTNFVQS